MNKNYTPYFMSAMLVMSLATVSYAQNPKVKTITIINGDTTITESNLNEKEIQVSINDGDDSSKKIVKKIIINDEKHDGDAMAYAYAIGDEGEDVQVSTSEDGKETKIVIKKGDGKDSKDKAKVVKKEVKVDGSSKEKNSLNLNINVKNTTAKIEVETSSKEPLNISILDENGKQVFYESQKTGGKYSKEVALEKKGTYFLNLIQNKTSTTEKIIVE